jgi:hypothetical protein
MTDNMQTVLTEMAAVITAQRAEFEAMRQDRDMWQERADRALDDAARYKRTAANIFKEGDEARAAIALRDGTIAELRNRVELQRKELERLQALGLEKVTALIHDRNVARDRVRELEAQLADATPPAPTWVDVQKLMEGQQIVTIHHYYEPDALWGVQHRYARLPVWCPTLAAAVAAATAKQEGAQ